MDSKTVEKKCVICDILLYIQKEDTDRDWKNAYYTAGGHGYYPTYCIPCAVKEFSSMRRQTFLNQYDGVRKRVIDAQNQSPPWYIYVD